MEIVFYVVGIVFMLIGFGFLIGLYEVGYFVFVKFFGVCVG